MEKEIKIWFDKEADYLEVMFEVKEGYFKDTKNGAVMVKVDMEGNAIGFSVFEESMKCNESLMKKLSEM